MTPPHVRIIILRFLNNLQESVGVQTPGWLLPLSSKNEMQGLPMVTYIYGIIDCYVAYKSKWSAERGGREDWRLGIYICNYWMETMRERAVEESGGWDTLHGAYIDSWTRKLEPRESMESSTKGRCSQNNQTWSNGPVWPFDASLTWNWG